MRSRALSLDRLFDDLDDEASQAVGQFGNLGHFTHRNLSACGLGGWRGRSRIGVGHRRRTPRNKPLVDRNRLCTGNRPFTLGERFFSL